MGIEDLAARLDDLSRNREALTLLVLQGERAVPFLAEVLLGPPSSIPESRCLAAEGLGAIGGEAAVSALIRVLTLHDIRSLDPILRLAEGAVRNRAAEQLGKIGDQRAVEPLLYVLAREEVREAMGALARFKEERAIAHIVRRLEDPCDRAAAADALLTFRGAAVPALAATMGERRPSHEDEAPVSVERRAEAGRLLGIVGDRSVVALLCLHLDDPAAAVQLEAGLALAVLMAGDIPDRALAVIALGLSHPSPPIVFRCMDALVEAGDRSIPHLLAVGPPRRTAVVGPRRPGDDALQVSVIETLERIGSEASAQAIEDFLHDRSSLVSERAQRALLHLSVSRPDQGNRPPGRSQLW